jgi:hypothetical protein
MAEDDTDGGVTISARKARDLVNVIESAKKAVKRINDGKNGEVRSAQERYGISGAIAALMHKLDQMSAEDLADWRDEFDHWWIALGYDKRAESAPRFAALSHQDAEDDAERSAA